MIKEVSVTLACLVTAYDSLLQREIYLWKQHGQMISLWILCNIFQIQIISISTQTILEIPYVSYISFSLKFWHSIPFSGSEGSPEMLPTYLVSWNYKYGEVDFITISYSKISQEKRVFGGIGHGDISSVSGAYS